MQGCNDKTVAPYGAHTGAVRRSQLFLTLGFLAGIVVVSDAGYYFLLPALGLPTSYNASPLAIAAYYVGWSAIVVIAFRRLFREWSPFGSRYAACYLFLSIVAALTIFATVVLPMLPPINWHEPWSPPELPLATPWYFVPKSADILFQQLLIAALVLAFSAQRFSLWTISASCALSFGATHLLLVFAGLPIAYVIRFMVAATAFGLVFPYLILRVPNGIGYSYMAHWAYYALSVVMAHAMYVPGAGHPPSAA